MDGSRTFVAGLVLAFHAALLWAGNALTNLSSQPLTIDSQPTVQVAVIESPPRNGGDFVVLAELPRERPTLDDRSISAIRFIDPDEGLLKGIVGSVSAPELDPAVKVESKPYAEQAGLSAGAAVTILLAIEVQADGTAGEITVISGPKDSMIEMAAIEYARALKWIPGTLGRHPQAMRINFPVTLAMPA
jgi:outer membrane biosynthesis protein TonB